MILVEIIVTGMDMITSDSTKLFFWQENIEFIVSFIINFVTFVSRFADKFNHHYGTISTIPKRLKMVLD